MFRFFFALTLVTGVNINALCQSVSTLMGARSNGLGYTSSCLSDEWSLFNNVGGLAKIERPLASASYDFRPSFPAGNRAAAVIAAPVKYGVAAFGFFKFGDNLYSEQIVSAGFSNKLGIASLGAKVNYIQYNAEGFGTKGVLSLSLGGITELTPHLKIGVHIINLNQPSISRTGDEHLPTILTAGAAFTPGDKVFITAEIEKDLEYSPIWKAGLEYKPFDKVAFRTGFNLHPNASFFGTGFHTKKLHIDYAIQYSSTTGSGHQASVSYLFKTK